MTVFFLVLQLFRWKKQHNAMSEDFDPLQLDNDMITELVGKFLAKHKEREESVEQRVEQLECQVTEMSFDLIRMKSKCHAYEAGLKQLSHVKEINAMKDQVYQLQVIAGRHFLSCRKATYHVIHLGYTSCLNDYTHRFADKRS